MTTAISINEAPEAIRRDAEYFATYICEAYRKSVQAHIETGRRIIEAKNALEHGEFMQMVQDRLPFSISTAGRYMRVASDARILNCANLRNMPPSLLTLDTITRLNDEQFETAIADGTIHPDVTRAEIAKILNPPEPQMPLDFHDAVQRLEDAVCGVIDKTEQEHRKALGPILREWSETIEQHGGL
jgi:hypothetical protein